MSSVDKRDAKMRAHPGADHLRIPGVDRLGGEIDRVYSRCGGGAQERPEIAGIAQAVNDQHQRRRVVRREDYAREREDGQNPLWRLHITQPIEEAALDDARVHTCRKREVSPRLGLILPHEQETGDGAGLQGIVDGPAPFDDKRPLGGTAVAPGEGAHQGNGGVGSGGDDFGGKRKGRSGGTRVDQPPSSPLERATPLPTWRRVPVSRCRRPR